MYIHIYIEGGGGWGGGGGGGGGGSEGFEVKRVEPSRDWARMGTAGSMVPCALKRFDSRVSYHQNDETRSRNLAHVHKQSELNESG